MKHLILFLLLISINLKSQNIFIKNSTNNRPISDVILYCNGKYINKSSKIGSLNIQNVRFKNSDTLTFNKNNFDTKKINFSSLSNEIFMDSIRTKEIKEIIIKKLNPLELIDKINQNFSQNSYIYPNDNSFWQILNSLSNKNEELIYYNDIFINKKDGTYTSNLTNFINKSKKIEIKDNLYNQKYFIYLDKYIFKENFIFYPFSFQQDKMILEILKNPKNYNYKINYLENNKILLYISKVDFSSTLIINSDDYGILNFTYNLENYKEKSNKFKNQKIQNYQINSKKVTYNFEKIIGKYQFKSISVLIDFYSKEDNSPFIYNYKRNRIEPFRIDNLRKINIITLINEDTNEQKY